MRRPKMRILLAMMLLLSMLLAACGGNGTATTAPAGTAGTKTTAPAAVTTTAPVVDAEGSMDELINIDVVAQNDKPYNPDSPIRLAINEKFNVDINYIYLDRNNMVELLNVRMAAGQIPDLFREGYARCVTLYEQGVLLGIDRADIEKFAPTLLQLTNDFFGMDAFAIHQFAGDGKDYVLPTVNVNNTYGEVPIWRDDWLKAVGINEIPYKWADIEKAVYAFRNDDPDGNGKKDTYGLADFGINYLRWAFGGNWDTWIKQADGTIMPNLLTPEFKQYYETMAKWYKDGVIDPEFTTGANRGQYWANDVPFWNGTYGFTKPGTYYHVSKPQFEGDAGSTNWQGFAGLAGANGATYEYGVVPEGPTGIRTAPYTFGGPLPTAGGVIYGKNADRAKMIRMLQIYEQQMSDWDTWLLMDRGVEGVSFEWVNVDGVETTKSLPIPADWDQNLMWDCRTNAIGMLSGTQTEFLKRCVPFEYKFADTYATPEALGAELYKSPVFLALPSEATIKADLNKIMDEAHALLVDGQKPLSDWDALIDQMKAAGLQTWIDEANEFIKTH